MKYYKIHQNNWVRSMLDNTKKQVILYNDDFTILGVGLY